MPDFIYDGPGGTYPTLRDSAGALVNLAVPGEVRDFGTAPDSSWRELTGQDRARIAAAEAEDAAAAAEAALAEVAAPEGDAPPAPVLAPPAVFPPPVPPVTPAGAAGSEEQ